jgi:hypothetical protein
MHPNVLRTYVCAATDLCLCLCRMRSTPGPLLRKPFLQTSLSLRTPAHSPFAQVCVAKTEVSKQLLFLLVPLIPLSPRFASVDPPGQVCVAKTESQTCPGAQAPKGVRSKQSPLRPGLGSKDRGCVAIANKPFASSVDLLLCFAPSAQVCDRRPSVFATQT